MGIFESILQTDTFSTWLNKLNSYADHASPTGTGTVEFHDIRISGDIYYGTTTASVLFKKEVEGYYLDSVSPPLMGTGFGRKYASFSPSSNNVIFFDFNFSNFHDITEDRFISLGYCMSSSQSANIVLHIDYYIAKDTEELTDVPTGTSRIVATVNSTQNIFDLSEELSILGADISSRNDLCYIKLMRVSDNASDTHNGYFNLFDIKII